MSAIDAWKSSFGDAYTQRHQVTAEGIIRQRRLWAKVLPSLPPQTPLDVLEVGSNVGLNLWALSGLLPKGSRFAAVEPNDVARNTLVGSGLVQMGDAYADLTHVGEAFDLVFTCGVLIHIPPDDLLSFCKEIHDRANRWIVAAEYFSPKPEEVEYRGHAGRLWKRDFGSFYLDHFPDLKVVDYGFMWKRVSGLDDLTWVLLEKAQ